MKKRNLTKLDIANKINSKLGYSKQESKEFVDFVFNRIIDKVALKEIVKIPKLGNFYLRRKNKRIGRNPKTGKAANISERNVVSFKPSKYLKNKINK